MKTTALLLISAFCLLASCNRYSLGPYRNYKITNDEAIPASKIGGAPWRHHP